MERPQIIYWVLVALIALPLAVLGRGRIAAAVFAVLLIAMVLIGLMGLPVFSTYAVLHGVAFVWSLRQARSVEAKAVGSLFLVLALLDLWGVFVDETRAYWAVLVVACVQVLLLPAIADWARIRKAAGIIGKTIHSDHLERRRHERSA